MIGQHGNGSYDLKCLSIEVEVNTSEEGTFFMLA